MNAPERTQVETDEEREYFGQLTLIDCQAAEDDRTRQEFKQEADINHLMSKYGALPPTRLPGGEWDFDLDLQAAFEAVRTVRDGFRRIPQEVRDRYPTPQALVDAIMRGEVVHKSETDAAGSSGAAGADSASAAPPGPKLSREEYQEAFREWLKAQKDPGAAPDKA